MNEEFCQYTVYITRIPQSMTESNLNNIMDNHGKVKFFRMKQNMNDGTPYALCRFYEPWHARSACESLCNKPPLNLKVTFARKRHVTIQNDKKKYNKNGNNANNSFQDKNTPNTPSSENTNWTSSLNKNDFAQNFSNYMNKFREQYPCKCFTSDMYLSVFEGLTDSNNGLRLNVEYVVENCTVCEKNSCIVKFISPQPDNAINVSSPNASIKDGHMDIKVEPTSFRDEENQATVSQIVEIHETEPKPYIGSNKKTEESLPKLSPLNDVSGETYEVKSVRPQIPLSYMDPKCEINSEVGIEIVHILNNREFVCTVVPSILSGECSSLDSDLGINCENSKKGSNRFLSEDHLLAVTVLDHGEIKWYRAFYACNKFALIDKGKIIKTIKPMEVIKCPEMFAKIPMTACMLTVLDKSADMSESCFIGKIVDVNGERCKVLMDGINAILSPWNYDDIIRNQNKMGQKAKGNSPDQKAKNNSSYQKAKNNSPGQKAKNILEDQNAENNLVDQKEKKDLTNQNVKGNLTVQKANDNFEIQQVKDDIKIQNVKGNLTVQKANDNFDIQKVKDDKKIQKSENDFEYMGRYRLPKLSSGKTVIIENYINSRNIFIRLEGSCKDHELLINDAFREGFKAKALETPPELNKVVLCAYNNDDYRGLITDFNESDDTYGVCLLDIGVLHRVKLNKLKECSENLADRPLITFKVALKNADAIEPYEPSKKVKNFMYDLVQKEILVVCIFEGDSPFVDGVNLKIYTNGKNINEILEDFTMPEYDRLKKGNKELHKLRVFMYDDVERMCFNDLMKKNEVVLTVLDTSRFVEDNFIACTKYDVELWNEYEIMLKRINDYCAVQNNHYFPRKGEVCLALNKNGKWFRAIACTAKVDNVLLMYPDCYDVGDVSYHYIKKILKEFVEVPLMSRICYISGIDKDADKAVLKKAAEILQEKKTITVTKIDYYENDGYIVDCPELIDELKQSGLL